MTYVVTIEHDGVLFTEVYTSQSEIDFLQRTGLHGMLTDCEIISVRVNT